MSVSSDTVRRWIKSGRVRTVKIDGVVLIPATEAERLLSDAA
jgi:predicted site-specific integrase-resolvase